LRTWTPSAASPAPDSETAVIAEEARKVLIRFDERVCHYQTAVEA
jgi:hypothetical protein